MCFQTASSPGGDAKKGQKRERKGGGREMCNACIYGIDKFSNSCLRNHNKFSLALHQADHYVFTHNLRAGGRFVART